jgi:hypothetical protein
MSKTTRVKLRCRCVHSLWHRLYPFKCIVIGCPKAAPSKAHSTMVAAGPLFGVDGGPYIVDHVRIIELIGTLGFYKGQLHLHLAG